MPFAISLRGEPGRIGHKEVLLTLAAILRDARKGARCFSMTRICGTVYSSRKKPPVEMLAS
jgi:hypothetical protein